MQRHDERELSRGGRSPRPTGRHRRRIRSVLAVAALTGAVVSGCEPSDPVRLDPLAGSKREEANRRFREIVEASNEATGARQMQPAELRRRLQRGEEVVLLDVREPQEHAVACLPGATLLPPDRLAKANPELGSTPGGVPIVTYCTVGSRSGLAAVELERRLGRPVFNLHGGIIRWFNEGGQVVDPETGESTSRIHPYSEEWERYVDREEP